MDELSKMAMRRIREAESSALSDNRRKMLDAFESASSRAAFEAINMPDFSKAAFDALRGLESHHLKIIEQATLASPFLDAMRENERQLSQMFGSQNRAMMEAMKSITQPRFDSVFESIKSLNRINLEQLGSIAGSSTLAALSYTNPALDSVFSASSFATTVAESIRSALQSDTINARMFEGLEQLIEEKVAALPRNQVTAQGLWRIINDILLVLLAASSIGLGIYQINDAQNTVAQQQVQSAQIAAQEDARSVQILEFLKQVADNTAKLVPENDKNKYYVVERQVVLRVKPNNRAAKIVILFPNQKVLLGADKHKWIYIEYFDYLEGIPKYGWANKKYLKKVD